MKRLEKTFQCNHSCILLFALLITSSGFSAPISPNEATMIADLWYAMELNSGYLEISETERAERFAQMGNRQVLYMVSKDELVDEFTTERQVLAYIVKYIPNGFVVVSGDDRIEPVMVCSAESEFRWDKPELNFLRYYLGKVMPALWKHMPVHTHENWSLLRRKLPESRHKVTYDNTGRAIYILWDTALWHQGAYYNDTCRAHNGGNNVPTGCVATAMAIKMKFHSWPPSGVGSHSYSDTSGSIQFDHDVNFGNQSYDWDSMPDNPLASPNSEVARIMYHAGVSVDMDYELDASDASGLVIAGVLNNYFRYRGTVTDTSSPSGLIPPIKTSIIGKLPVVCGGEGHEILVDGYRDDIGDYFHMNLGWNGSGNGWFRLDSLPWDTTGTGVIEDACVYSQPNNWIYVNKDHSGIEDGRILYPYNSLKVGEVVSVAGGELLIKTETYTGTDHVPIIFDNEVAIRAYAGDVVIGENLWLKNYEAIKLHSGGELEITPE